MGSQSTWLERLRKTADILPDDLRDQILAAGANVVPALIEIMLDDTLLDEEEKGCPPTHAIALLGKLRATEAIEPMIRVLVGDELGLRLEAVLKALEAIGAPCADVGLRLLSDPDPVVRSIALDAIARSHSPDERAYKTLVELFEEDPNKGAFLLVAYGDRRALAVMERKIAAYVAREPDPLTGEVDLFRKILIAYEAFAGRLSEDLERRKIETRFIRDATLMLSTAISKDWDEAARIIAADRTAGRDPGKRFVEYAEPLRELMPGASYEKRLEAAWAVFECAASAEPSGDEARLDTLVPVALSPAESERARATFAFMLRRHRALFPEFARKGEPVPEKDLLDDVLETAAPQLGLVLASARAHAKPHDLVLVFEKRLDGQIAVMHPTRAEARELFRDIPTMRESLRRAIVSAIEKMQDHIPAVVIAHLPGDVLIAGVRGLRADLIESTQRKPVRH